VEGRHVVDARTIDEVNILQAAMLAMETSVGKLPRKPDFVLVDGNRLPMVIPVPRLSTSRLLPGERKGGCGCSYTTDGVCRGWIQRGRGRWSRGTTPATALPQRL
jgi:hypothetical protein